MTDRRYRATAYDFHSLSPDQVRTLAAEALGSFSPDEFEPLTEEFFRVPTREMQSLGNTLESSLTISASKENDAVAHVRVLAGNHKIYHKTLNNPSLGLTPATRRTYESVKQDHDVAKQFLLANPTIHHEINHVARHIFKAWETTTGIEALLAEAEAAEEADEATQQAFETKLGEMERQARAMAAKIFQEYLREQPHYTEFFAKVVDLNPKP